MADKTDKEEKRKNSTVKSVGEAIFGQAITEFTKPTVDKIPTSILKILKSVGIDKALPIISIALSTVFSKDKYPWGDKFGDFIAEATAELRRAMNEKVGGGEEDAPADKGKVTTERVKNLNCVLLNPRLVKEVTALLTTFAELFKDNAGKDRTEKEKKQILALLNQMNGKELYVFLAGEKEVRDRYLDAFVKKATEKSFEEALKDFKDELRKLAERAKIVCHEILIPGWNMVKPALDKVDGHFAATEPIGGAIVSFRQRAEAFRAEQKR